MTPTRHNPWHYEPEPQDEPEGWLTSYLDMMTLLLVLLVAMLALAGKEVVPVLGATTGVLPGHDGLLPGQTKLAVVEGNLPGPLTLSKTVDPTHQPQVTASEQVGGAQPEGQPHPRPDVTVDEEGVAQMQESEVLNPGALALSIDPVALYPMSPIPTAYVEDGWLQNRFPFVAEPGFADEPAASKVRTESDEPDGPPLTPADAGLNDLVLAGLGDDIEIMMNEKSISFRINSEILFESAKADLSLEGLSVLQPLLAVFRSTAHNITVEGHTDSVPIRSTRYPSNWELSGARAGSVVRYMQANGIARDRLRAVGYADTRGLADNNTEKGRATNRRVELILEVPGS